MSKAFDDTMLPDDVFYERYRLYGADIKDVASARSNPLMNDGHIYRFVKEHPNPVEALRRIIAIHPLPQFVAETLFITFSIHEGFYDAFVYLHEMMYHEKVVNGFNPYNVWWLDGQGCIKWSFCLSDPRLAGWFADWLVRINSPINVRFLVSRFKDAANDGRIKMMKWIYEYCKRNDINNIDVGVLTEALQLAKTNGHLQCADYATALLQKSKM